VHIVSLPHEPVADEREWRARAALSLRRAREVAGRSPAEWGMALEDIIGRPVSPELVETWEDPAGPLPPMHWGLALVALGGPTAVEALSALLLT
jgi:hypothetical protein